MLLIQLPTELQEPLEVFCTENETNPTEVISDLLAGLLLHTDAIVVEDTGISVYDIIDAFCTLLDGTLTHELVNLGLSNEQADHISRVRAAVHDIWMGKR